MKSSIFETAEILNHDVVWHEYKGDPEDLKSMERMVAQNDLLSQLVAKTKARDSLKPVAPHYRLYTDTIEYIHSILYYSKYYWRWFTLDASKDSNLEVFFNIMSNLLETAETLKLDEELKDQVKSMYNAIKLARRAFAADDLYTLQQHSRIADYWKRYGNFDPCALLNCVVEYKFAKNKYWWNLEYTRGELGELATITGAGFRLCADYFRSAIAICQDFGKEIDSDGRRRDSKRAECVTYIHFADTLLGHGLSSDVDFGGYSLANLIEIEKILLKGIGMAKELNADDLVLDALAILLHMYVDHEDTFKYATDIDERNLRIRELLEKLPQLLGGALNGLSAVLLLSHCAGHLYLTQEQYDKALVWLLRAQEVWKYGDFAYNQECNIKSCVERDLEKIWMYQKNIQA
ncbi:hypothetical protein FACS1894125_2310 [Actinomycetota bacterium]|nr:hypothetical protein FACS1894125_2310 [Actinomycetota bacterium]